MIFRGNFGKVLADRQAIGLREKVPGKEHPSTVRSKGGLAGVVRGQGNHKQAEEMHRQNTGAKGDGAGQGAS
jgi:hypothetical protein